MLEGSKIRLRDFAEDDRAAFTALADDDRMFTYMKFRIDRASAPSMVDYLIGEPTPSRRNFNLVVEGSDGFAGWAGLGPVAAESCQAEFGWYLASAHWGRGYATEATELLKDFAARHLHLRRLIATADPENRASVRVLEKCGLVCEGETEPVDTWRGSRPRLLFSIELPKVPDGADEEQLRGGVHPDGPEPQRFRPLQ